MGPIGRWYLDENQNWVYDARAESEPRVRLPIEPVDAPPRPGDVGDWIDPNAPDPTPGEVVDRGDPNYVDPWFGPR